MKNRFLGSFQESTPEDDSINWDIFVFCRSKDRLLFVHSNEPFDVNKNSDRQPLQFHCRVFDSVQGLEEIRVGRENNCLFLRNASVDLESDYEQSNHFRGKKSSSLPYNVHLNEWMIDPFSLSLFCHWMEFPRLSFSKSSSRWFS